MQAQQQEVNQTRPEHRCQSASRAMAQDHYETGAEAMTCTNEVSIRSQTQKAEDKRPMQLKAQHTRLDCQGRHLLAVACAQRARSCAQLPPGLWCCESEVRHA